VSQMHDTLVDFVKVLRTADIKVSPAETLDAMETLDLVGFDDRRFLKNSLALVLSKNPEEKEAFETCFAKFFTFEKMRTLNEDEADNGAGAADDGEFDDGDFDSEGNPSGQSSGKCCGQGGGADSSTEEAEALDFEPLAPTSELGKLLMSGNRMEVLIKMTEAGRAVGVNESVVFTQKGVCTRKSM